MALRKESWLPLAEALHLEDGRSRRVDHDCGSGRTLKLSRVGGKLDAWCHRCNDGGYHAIQESLADRIARLKNAGQADAVLAQVRDAPPEGERDPRKWPAEARLWFARAGLHSGDIGALDARFDPSSGRVVLPCGGGFWQARAIRPGQMPKYLAPLVPKVYPTWGKAERVTLTEDILSAYKVGKAGGEGWCMLGTSLPQELLVRILSRSVEVNVWLDNDLPPKWKVNRGQVAAAKIMKKLRALGVPVRNLVTEQDPKLIPFDRIKELVS